MSITFSQPAIAVEYAKLIVPPLEKLTDESLNEIVLFIQGRAVEIADTKETVLALKIFHHLYKFSPEVVYKTLEGKKYLIFDHQLMPVIRDEELTCCLIENETVELPVSFDISVNVDDLWNKTSGVEIDRLRQLMILLKKYKRAEVVTLLGDAPILVLLLVQSFFEGGCKSLFYQKERGADKVLVY